MGRETKILIGGLAVGLLVFGAGFVGSKYIESELRGLIQSCEDESERSRATAKHEWDKGKLVCEPDALSSLGDSIGIQARIVDTKRNANKWGESSRFLAILIVVIGALPYAWYFLLKRIRELREALVGK